jgi:hypothetical protein
MGTSHVATEGEELAKLDYEAACHILKELLFLAGLSSINLQRLCSAGVLLFHYVESTATGFKFFLQEFCLTY